MGIALGITGVLFIIAVLTGGLERALRIIPVLIIIGLLITVFGYIAMAFFPLILVYLVFSALTGKKNNKKGTGSFYYRSTSANNQEEFEEFFRRASEGFSGYNNTGNNGEQNNYRSNNYGSYFEDKSKYYRILGLQQGASQAEIKKAFREKAKLYHPDKFANESEAVRAEQERKFKEINEAHDKLTN